MTDRDEAGRFLPGNRFWKARSSAGPKPKFECADDLWSACAEYFDWVHDNPLYADQLVTFRGQATHEPVAKMRAMTIGGLCLFLDIDETTWRDWKASRSDLSPIITRAEAVIFAQKFEGAAADLLNGNIIARELGLSDKQTVEGPGPNGEHVVNHTVDDELRTALDAIAGKIASGDKSG